MSTLVDYGMVTDEAAVMLKVRKKSKFMVSLKLHTSLEKKWRDTGGLSVVETLKTGL